MTSEAEEPATAFVWLWLPDAAEPVVCGRLDDDGARISFTYARSFLERPDAVAVYEPELPLRRGPQFARDGGRLPLCIDDTMPDAWGRRIVQHRLGDPTGECSELTYLLESGSDRVGALDHQASSDNYRRRGSDGPTLDDLAEAAARIEAGEQVAPELADALVGGTSLGGARPKATLRDGERSLLAKFSASTDPYPVVQAEFVAMRLARLAGVDAAPVELVRAGGRHALLVERFDRSPGGRRRRVVSALTVLGLAPYPAGRYATYLDLADALRRDAEHPERDLAELFGRISWNILCGNTDDHGRNHAVFVDEVGLSLTPAYDVCPQARTGREAALAMAFGPDGTRVAQVARLVAAADGYHLDPADARAVVTHQIDTIRARWSVVCDEAELTRARAAAMWERQFLHPFALEGFAVS